MGINMLISYFFRNRRNIQEHHYNSHNFQLNWNMSTVELWRWKWKGTHCADLEACIPPTIRQKMTNIWDWQPIQETTISKLSNLCVQGKEYHHEKKHCMDFPCIECTF